MLGADFTIEGNDLRATRNLPDNSGAMYFAWDQAGITRGGSTFRFARNRVDLGPYIHAVATFALTILNHASGSLPNTCHVAIVDNEFRSSATPDGTMRMAVQVQAGAGRSFETVTVSGNRGNLGIYINSVGAKVTDLSDNRIIGARHMGVYMAWPATPVYTACEVIVDGGMYLRPWHTCLQLHGSAALDTTLLMSDVTALSAAQGGHTGASATNSSMYLNNFARIVRRHCTLGTLDAVTVQTRADTISNVTDLQEIDDTILGTVTLMNRTTVTSRLFRGRGSGAPVFVAAIGSEYTRTDGGASTTKYLNETGTSTWRAI